MKKKCGIQNFVLLVCLVAGILLVASIACKRLPFVPGEDAVIFLEAVPNLLACSQQAKIIIKGEKNSGYPLPDGTIVNLSTTSGSLANKVELTGGYAETTFQADDNFSGEVIITARCGLAVISPDQLIITVFKTDITYLFISANPKELPIGGGNTTITSQGLDENMNPVPGKNIWLQTSAGVLEITGNGITDQQGKVTAYLTTTQPATVSAKYKDIETSVNISIQEENKLPTAAFTYSPLAPQSGQKIYFNAAASSDPDGKIIAFQWDFGDGKAGTGKAASHVYNVSQTTTYIVTLTVTDDRAGQAVSSKEITITFTGAAE